MYRTKGRPPKVKKEDFVKSVVAFKDRIVISDKIVPKTNSIWSEISISLNGKLESTSIYAMVCNNVYGVRNKLHGHIQDASTTNAVNMINTSLEDLRYKKNIKPVKFLITVPNTEFNELIVFKSYKHVQKKKIRHRIWKTLRPGLWEDFITKKIWDAVKLKCGFRFRNHYLSNNGTSGYINGSCKCGSTLQCVIENQHAQEILLKCKVIKGAGKCSKRFVRVPLKKTTGLELCTKPMVHRAERVEGEFNKIKNCSVPMREDNFLKIHLDYLREELNVNGEPKLCPACNNIDVPSGALICAICKITHALNKCSMAYGEEAGQKKICLPCSSLKSKNILATRETENRRGLILNNKKHKAKYLGDDPRGIKDALTWRSAKLPIIKNGNSRELQAGKIEDRNYCFVNTCAFDSLLQIVLATLSDYKDFEYEIRKIENKLYEMAKDILKNGITAYTYKLRGQLLLSIFTTRDVHKDCIHVDCQTNVGYLASQLFKNTPSFEEISVCNKGCPPRWKKLTVSQIEYNYLLKGDVYNIIENNVVSKGKKKCCHRHCTDFETTKLCKIGPIVLFDIYTIKYKNPAIKLEKIAHKIANPLNPGKELQLLGIVDFKYPAMAEIGHYTAIVPRPGNCWVEYNDLASKEKIMEKTCDVNPHLLVYM